MRLSNCRDDQLVVGAFAIATAAMVIEPQLDSGICDGQKNEQGIIIGGSGDENSESFGTSGEPEETGFRWSVRDVDTGQVEAWSP